MFGSILFFGVNNIEHFQKDEIQKYTLESVDIIGKMVRFYTSKSDFVKMYKKKQAQNY
jgi:hypothetical protein